MGSFKLGGMTFGSLFRKPETICYPFEKKPLPEGLKGHIENDVDNCILCGICQKSCPADAIVVDKPSRTWTIDPFMCVQCGSCVRACPKKCLTMLPTYTPVSPIKFTNSFVIPESEKDKQKKAAKSEV